MIPSPELSIGTDSQGATCSRRWRWFCPLRFLVVAHLLATLLTGSGLAYLALAPRLAGNTRFPENHPRLTGAVEVASLVAFLTLWLFPPLILTLARRRGVARNEFLRLLLATTTLATAQVLAVLGSLPRGALIPR